MNACDYYFGLRIHVSKRNAIRLNFSETLEKDLSIKNIELIITLKHELKLVKKSENQYLILLKFFQTLPSGSNVTLNIKQKPLFSTKFSKLKYYEFNIQLNDFTYISDEAKTIEKYSKVYTQIVVNIIAGVSMASNPSNLWTLLNTIQLIKFLPLSQEKLPDSIEKLCLGLGYLNLIPNLFEYVFASDSASEPDERLKAVGIKTLMFWINVGPSAIYFIIGMISWPIIFIISNLDLGEFALKTKKILLNYRYNFFIRFWIQNFVEINLFSLISLLSVKYN